ncbi:MAG: hypothetical protein AAGI30_09945 [Planctomycetota bacterium]
MRTLRSRLAPIALGVALAQCGCGSLGTDANIVALEHDGLRLEFMLDRDRVVYAGPTDGPNMVHLDEATMALGPHPEGDYRFFGGGYSWISPQNDPVLGWRDDAGELMPWPPDPAMDRGPVELVRRFGSDELTNGVATGFYVVSPQTRVGLVEEKSFSLYERTMPHLPGAGIAYRLRNATDRTVTGGTWFNTAVPGDGLIAVPGPPSATVRMVDTERHRDFDRLVAERRPHWILLDLSRATHEGGFKFYIDGPPKIAVWRDGWWLRRESMPGTTQRLIDAGEGAVAIYTDAGAELHEAELYGPLVDIQPGGSTATIEGWWFYEGAPTLGGLVNE